MKRSPLRRNTPLRAKPQTRDKADTPLAPWCEIAKAEVCTGRAVHRHHVILQSQGGRGGPTLDVCSACHDYAHAHRAEARAHGWIIDTKSGAA